MDSTEPVSIALGSGHLFNEGNISSPGILAINVACGSQQLMIELFEIDEDADANDDAAGSTTIQMTQAASAIQDTFTIDNNELAIYFPEIDQNGTSCFGRFFLSWRRILIFWHCSI